MDAIIDLLKSGPVLALCSTVLVLIFTRRGTVTDRLAAASQELGKNVLGTTSELLDRLKEEIAELRRDLEEEREACRKEQDSLRRELRVIRDHCVRQGWNLPEEPTDMRRA